MNTLQALFTVVLNMSITASYVAVGVISLRLLLKKSPKVFSYVLWSAVLFRLICPVSIPSGFSLLGLMNPSAGMDYIPKNIGTMRSPAIHTGMNSVDGAINASLPAATGFASVNPMQVWMFLLSFVWLLGILALLLYSVFSYVNVKRRLATATLVFGNVYETDRIGTAFVCGFFNPRIYIPMGIGKEDLSTILAHEQTHIRRRDYLIKPLAFLALCIHWFNPLVWISFSLMSRDMEMSCDESVLKKLGGEAKGSYSGSLLTLSVRSKGPLSANPLAFGENHVKARIKNVLHYKKPSFWILSTAAVLAIIAAVCLITNPIAAKQFEQTTQAQNLLRYKTEYVGDNSKVGGILVELPVGDALQRNGFALGTATRPYSITVNLNGKDEDVAFYKNKSNQTLFERNAIILFSLISNVDHVNFDLLGEAGHFVLQYTREWANDSMGQDVRKYAVNPEAFEDFLNTITSKLTKVTEAEEVAQTSAAPVDSKNTPTTEAISALVEENLAAIESSPKESSNPQDYIDMHREAYENIVKYGGEEALMYMLAQFEANKADGLRGHIMMKLCKEFLGARNNVTDASLSPQQWYAALSIRQEVKLPDYTYDGSDLVGKLVYATETANYSNPERGFTVVAPKIFKSVEEGDRFKVFVTTFSITYKLYGNVLSEEGGSVVPAAITYRKNSAGDYVLEKYEQAKDGSYNAPSIREFCTLPISGKVIRGLANEILSNDGKDLHTLQLENLLKHLKANGLTNIIQYSSTGEVLFIMSAPELKP